MTVYDLAPNALAYEDGAWTPTGEPTELAAVVSTDDGDYILKDDGNTVATIAFTCAEVTLGGNERFRRGRMRVRTVRPSGGLVSVRYWSTIDPSTGAPSYDKFYEMWATFTGSRSAGWDYGPWSAAVGKVDAGLHGVFGLQGAHVADGAYAGSGTRSQVLQVGLQVETFTVPVVTITAPTNGSTVAGTPLLTWTTSHSGAGTLDRILLEVTPAGGDTQTIYGSLVGGSLTLPPLPNFTSVTIRAAGAKVVDGVTHWGPTTSITVTVNDVASVPPPQVTAEVWNPATQAVELTLVDRANRLSPNVATGTESLGDTTGFSAVANSTLASSTTGPLVGARCLTITRASSNGTMAVNTLSGASGFGVTPGETITALASLRAVATPRNWRIRIDWYDAGGASTGTPVTGSSVLLSTSAYTQAVVTTTVPAGAVRARLNIATGDTCSVGEAVRLDCIAAHAGSDPYWGAGPSAVEEFQLVTSDGRTLQVPADSYPQLTVTDRYGPRDRTVDYAISARLAGYTQFGGNTSHASVDTVSDGQFWFKVPDHPELDTPFTPLDVLELKAEEHGGIHRPIDAAPDGQFRALKIDGGRLTWWSDVPLKIRAHGDTWDTLEPVLRTGGPILLQDCYGGQRWIAWNGPINAPTFGAPASPWRTVTVGVVEVAAP